MVGWFPHSSGWQSNTYRPAKYVITAPTRRPAFDIALAALLRCVCLLVIRLLTYSFECCLSVTSASLIDPCQRHLIS